MSFEELLNSLCTVQQYTVDSRDAYGQPIKVWDDIDDVRCRWSTPRNREVQVGMEVVIADLQLFLEVEIEITERDRIVLSGQTYEVLSVASRQDASSGHHTECLLRSVK